MEEKLKNINNYLDRLRRSVFKPVYDDLTIEKNYNSHGNLITEIGNILMKKEGKEFIIDDNNKAVLRFLLYYFNECELFSTIFPEKKYSLNNQILLCGKPGTGKTIIMQIFSEYLKATENPKSYNCTSVSKMLNYYKIHNHLDKYTYNENAGGFEGKPSSYCVNDIGLDSYKHFGTDVKIFVDEFLHSRNEIFIESGKVCHVTTNLSGSQINTKFDERLIDRFKTYNIIHLTGESRR